MCLFFFFIKCSRHILFHQIIPGEFRTALRIFTKIIIICEHFPEQIFFFFMMKPYIIQQYLISGTPLVLNGVITIVFVIRCKPVIHGECRIVFLFQFFHRIRKLTAVIVDLHHLLNPFQAQYIFIGNPLCIQYFIRRMCFMDNAILLLMFLHKGSFQHFQESKLELLRF